MVVALLLGLLQACAAPRHADVGVDPIYAQKLDAPLRSAMVQRAEGDPIDILVEIDSTAVPTVVDGLVLLGFEHMTSSGNIATGRATAESIRRMVLEPDVRSISLSQERPPN